MPEIEFIQGSLRRETINVFLDHCPTYFWYKPASSTGKHHPPDQGGRFGLWLHTKRSFVAHERLARSLYVQDLIDIADVNCSRAAILLHDLFKYGSGGRYTESNHDVLVAQVFHHVTNLPEQVVDLVETHNGP